MLPNTSKPVARAVLLRALVSLLCAALLSACAGATPTPEPANITFAAPGLDSAVFDAWVEEFHLNNPYITVERHTGEPEDADVFRTSPFALAELLEQENVLNLGPFVEQDPSADPSSFYPGTLGLFTVRGQVWALPATVDVMVMYYNRDLFDRYGVPYPQMDWTWDDFLATAMALRDPTNDVFGYGPVDPFLDALSFIYGRGGRIFDDLSDPTRTTYDDPATIEALEWHAALIHTHNVAPTREQEHQAAVGGTARTGVYRNKVAMWLGWLSDRGGSDRPGADWPGEWDMRWGVVPLPSDGGAPTLGTASGYLISSQTSFPDACWQWISFLSQQMPQAAVPARRSLAESSAYRDRVGREVVDVAHASLELAALLSPGMMQFWGDLGHFWRAIDSISRGSATPEEAMVRAQRLAACRRKLCSQIQL